MSTPTTVSAGDLYRQIADAFLTDPTMEASLLEDFDGTVARRFGVELPTSGRLVRVGSGFRLSYDGKDYDLGDPRDMKKGELNDAELELVSAGDAASDCKQFGDSIGKGGVTF
jgi:hypothetical protein